MKEHVRMRIQNLGSMAQSFLHSDPAGLGSEQLMQKCEHLSSATSATSEVESFETDDDGSPISVREVLSVSVASCSSDGSGQQSGTGGGRHNGLPSVPITSEPIAGSSRGTAAKSPPASPPRRKSRNHLRSYQTTHKGRGSASASGTNASRRDNLRSSLQQQKLHAQKDLALSHPSTPVSPATAAPMPKTKLSRAVTAPEPKFPSSLVPTTKLSRSSSNPDDQAASNQVDLVEAATRSVRWSSTASVRTIDPVDAASRTTCSTDDSSIPSTSNSSAAPGSTQSRASTSGRPPSLHAKQRRTLQEIRDEVERIQKIRAAQAASTKPSRRTTKNRTIISNLPEEYSIPIADEAREGKLAARSPGDNASNTSSSEPLTTACESFKSCSSNISQLSTVPFAAMDTAVVSGLRISTTKGIRSDAASNQTAERAKNFLEEEREKERKYQRQKEKRNQKKKPSSSPPIREGTNIEESHKGSKKQPHPRSGRKGKKKKVAPIIWGNGIVQVLQEELHHETEEDDATAATSTTTDTAGARTKLRPVEEDAAGASKRKDEMTAAATACKSVWSIQSDATRVVDNRTTFAQTHFKRTV